MALWQISYFFDHKHKLDIIGYLLVWLFGPWAIHSDAQGSLQALLRRPYTVLGFKPGSSTSKTMIKTNVLATVLPLQALFGYL